MTRKAAKVSPISTIEPHGIYTVELAVEMTGISRRKILQLIKNKEIATVDSLRKKRILGMSIIDFLLGRNNDGVSTVQRNEKQ